MLRREPDDVTGQTHETTQKEEAIPKTGPRLGHSLHCQKTLTQERDDIRQPLFPSPGLDRRRRTGSLDKLVLLNNLIRQATPSEQIELIQVVEKLALLQPETTVQVSHL